jgi:hypothetical protein
MVHRERGETLASAKAHIALRVCVEMVIIGNLSADIVPGDFLIANKAAVGSSLISLAVCQVHHVTSSTTLEVTWWIESENSSPICSQSFPNIHRCRIKELFRDVNTAIFVDAVVDIAFVFAPHALEHIWTDCAGMRRVFLHEIATISHLAHW